MLDNQTQNGLQLGYLEDAEILLKRKTTYYRKRFEQACIVSGPLSVLLVFIGLSCGRLFPPMAADFTVDEVVEHYRRHHVGMRIGAILIMISCPFYAAWCGAVAVHTKRIPGCPTVAWVAGVVGGGISCSVFILPGLFLAIATFRPDRDPQVLYMLNDLFWITLTAPWEPLLTQSVAFSFAILVDRSPKRAFPRWLAYGNLFMMAMFIPSTGLHFVHNGPLAWNGGLSFWLPVVCYGLSLIFDCIFLLKRVAAEDYDDKD